jgi:hypothetical protein
MKVNCMGVTTWQRFVVGVRNSEVLLNLYSRLTNDNSNLYEGTLDIHSGKLIKVENYSFDVDTLSI